MIWQPIPIQDLGPELAGFEDWVLGGGHSVDLVAGKDSREHGDTDIGVLRSRLGECLRCLDRRRVFLCLAGQHVAWDGGEVPREVHDIWVTDRLREHWSFQIMVFDEEGDEVIYRRDPRIRWKRDHHHVMVNGIRVLNPFITFLFKANQTIVGDKDAHDLATLIASVSSRVVPYPRFP
ncbi:hypothetical protein [Haloferula sp. BvORR071]|uniref:hypothetical protein n=1 Tax=Haloferula sp. BvORR071 TaxID=1396141 RepID=UPI002240F546|nr:hypothetical protein [Haloferula sp. BvORR071]